MVKISNGIVTYEVTRGAFEDIYSHQGYFEVAKAQVTIEEPVQVEEEKSEDEIFCDELLEKPIAQWNKEEVKSFSSIKGIDISGTKNANEAKDLIKKYLEENE